MSPLEMLRDDHRRVEALFDRIQQSGDAQERYGLFERIRAELQQHARLEESVLYPYLRNWPEFHDIVEDSLAEHEDVRALLAEIVMAQGEEEFEDLVDELIEAVDHHVDQEEAELFAGIRESLDDSELEELGARLDRVRRIDYPAAA